MTSPPVDAIILQNASANSLSSAWEDTKPVSPNELEMFALNPVHGPNIQNARLDTTGKTLKEMKSSSWNQILISKMAQHAETLAMHSNNPEQYGYPSTIIQWDKLFEDRIHRILRDVAAHGSDTPAVLSVKKQLRSIRAWEQNVVTESEVKASNCNIGTTGDGDNAWGFILYAVGALEIDGMSYEEDGKEDGKTVKEVLDLDFRRH
ncbi:hypothetical protein BDP27DRAFT_1429586 [Rhodocollybia butyracea]|uniref:Uncharacterized protein n=1 Tax=Rhodocollybia butyracea TaxID=206335 RepID=A0A9P5TYU8_9AGAR|nr:hypothetical protein BDP27DRAFT_1429586 [Rhodocollybia butyracea]